MDQPTIAQYINATFTDVDYLSTSAGVFFIFDPGKKLPDTKRWPFATIVTTDNEFDRLSNLNRGGLFRLNVGVKKETMHALFGDVKTDAMGVTLGFNFEAADQLFPHPMYGRMHWLSVINPSDATFERLKPLLKEAYEISVRRVTKNEPRESE